MTLFRTPKGSAVTLLFSILMIPSCLFTFIYLSFYIYKEGELTTTKDLNLSRRNVLRNQYMPTAMQYQILIIHKTPNEQT